MFDALKYSDFFNIIVVAIGINLTYIIIDNKKIEDRSDFVFFGFLSTVSNKILDWISLLRKRSQKKEEPTQTRLEYYINSKKLQSETKGAFDMLIRELNDCIKKIDDAEEKAKHRINSCCKADNLSKIALVCTIYGLYFLFLGGVELRCETINIHAGIFICNIAILILLGHCLLWEKRTIQFKTNSINPSVIWLFGIVNTSFYRIGKTLAPRFILYLFLFFIAIGYSMSVSFSENPDIAQWLNGYNHINLFASLAICFCGFIVYTVVSLIFSICFLFKFLKDIDKIKIKEKVDDVERKVEHYKKELASIDNQMKKPVDERKFS